MKQVSFPRDEKCTPNGARIMSSYAAKPVTLWLVANRSTAGNYVQSAFFGTALSSAVLRASVMLLHILNRVDGVWGWCNFKYQSQIVYAKEQRVFDTVLPFAYIVMAIVLSIRMYKMTSGGIQIN